MMEVPFYIWSRARHLDLDRTAFHEKIVSTPPIIKWSLKKFKRNETISA